MARWWICSLCILVLLASTAFGQRPDRTLLGYSAVWRDAAVPPAGYDFSSLNYIARAFARPTADGSMIVPDGYFDPALEKQAHQHGVKLLISLGGGGASASDWISMATHPANLQRFLGNLDRAMLEQHYDGIDVDWEPPDPSEADGAAYGGFLKALRSRFPHAIITTALPADSYQTRFTPWAEVVADVDFVNVMAYDYSGPWSGVAGHASNLFPAGDYPPAAGKSVDEGMHQLIDHCHVPPSKLLLGMNFWAYRFRVDHLGDAFVRNAPGATDDLTYPQVLALLQTGKYRNSWDGKAAMPYLQRTGGGSVICYESPDSVRRKCDYAKSLGCAGMMVWNIGSDVSARQAPLMDAMVKACGGTPRLLTRGVLEAQVADAADAMGKNALPTPLPNLATLSVDQLETLNDQFTVQSGSTQRYAVAAGRGRAMMLRLLFAGTGTASASTPVTQIKEAIVTK